MPYYHVIAIRPGDRRKSIVNKSEEQVLTQYVVPFVSSGAIKTKWGDKTKTFQVIELRVYKTDNKWVKRAGETLEDHIKGRRNLFASFEKRAETMTGAGHCCPRKPDHLS